jgi:hypothetical protein
MTDRPHSCVLQCRHNILTNIDSVQMSESHLMSDRPSKVDGLIEDEEIVAGAEHLGHDRRR